MTIKVYSSIMPGEPDEVYHDHGVTVEQWIQQQAGDSYQRGEYQAVSCSINGRIIDPLGWPETVIGEFDSVEFRVVPRGDAKKVAGFVFPFWSASLSAAEAIIGAFIDIPTMPGAGQQGAQLSPADARANTARLGEGVPERFGEYICYPDYLNAPRKLYSGTKTQILRLMLSVGVGRYDIPESAVKIGETPINQLNGVSYQIFSPGASVAGNLAHENWYPAPEVGGTSNSAGIRLKGVTYDERTFFGQVTALNNNLVGVSIGALWTTGITGAIKMNQAVTVSFASPASVFAGAFQHLSAGMTVNVSSNLGVNGTYVVRTISAAKDEITLETTGGTVVDTATTGSGEMAIDKASTIYRLVDFFGGFQITVERLLSNGSADPDWTSELPVTSIAVDIVWNAETFTANRAGPFLACPDGETTDRIEVDFFAPSGLGTIDDESVLTRTRKVKIEYRELGTVPWQSETFTVSGNTRDQLGWTFGIDLPSPQSVEVRVSRIGGENVSLAALDRLEVTALRSRLPTVISYPGVTTMAVTIVGADDIGSQSNNRVNLVATRRLEPVGGGTETATRSISRAAAYVARSLGYIADQLDVAELEHLDNLWAARGDTFDFAFNSGTAKDAIDTILRAGFATMTLNSGVITPVRDQPRTQLEQPYSPENMTAPLQRSFSGTKPDEADGVEVEYTRAGTWTTETINCFLPGDQGIKVDKIKLDGVTDPVRAWRIGMRRRRGQQYRRWTYSFNTELDALNSDYLSYVPLLDDIPGYGKSSIMRGIESHTGGALVTVTEPMEWIDGKSHVIAYRNEYGDLVGPFPATRGDTDYQVIADIPQPWPDLTARQEPPHVFFGTSKRWSFPALVTEINPGAGLEVSVTATNYDERVYADDDNAPP